jgi:hypothetical protein
MESGEASAEVVGKERSEVQRRVSMSDARQRMPRHRAQTAEVSVGSRPAAAAALRRTARAGRRSVGTTAAPARRGPLRMPRATIGRMSPCRRGGGKT